MKIKYAMPIALLLAACGGDSNGGSTTNNDIADAVPGTFEFNSRYADEDSVAYAGQVARQVLIADLNTTIGGLTDAIDSGEFTVGGAGSVVSALDFYFRFDSDAYGGEQVLVSAELPLVQATHADISTDKDLVSKIAGNDAATDHKDFGKEFVGASVASPEAYVASLFQELEANAIARADGVERTAPNGEVLPVHITEDGRDLQQLTQKFLTGAVSFSQGADDYLDDGTEGKGILSPNTRDGDANYTVLEHQWDEGFGYFGAARDYLEHEDDLIAETGYRDANGDGKIDLLREFNFGASTNAAKRDRGSATGTDLTKQAFEAFWRGRHIIATAPEGESLDADTLAALREQRDLALDAWEKALSATVVHYINDTIDLTQKIGTPDYTFATHAKVWSEMKGFAFAFQFNPHSPLSDAQFAEVHELFGDAPVLTAEGAEAYVEDLLAARAILAEAYAFDAADVEGW